MSFMFKVQRAMCVIVCFMLIKANYAYNTDAVIISLILPDVLQLTA